MNRINAMKKTTRLAAVFLTALIVLAVLSWPLILERLKLESDKAFEIAVDYRGVPDIEISDAMKLYESKFTLFCDSGNTGQSFGFDTIMFVKTGESLKSGPFRYCFENNIIPDKIMVADKQKFICLNEFAAPGKLTGINREKIITLHMLSKGEKEKLSQEDIVKRFKRAAVERNIKILVAPDLATALKIKESLSALKYRQEKFRSNPMKMRAVSGKGQIIFKKSYALLLALSLPIFGFFLMRLYKGVFARFVCLTFVSLLASMIIAGTLSGTDFINKLNMFSGAKAALLLPALAVFFFLAYENKTLFDKKSVCILSAIALSFIVLAVIARSGNYSMPLLPFEKEVREWFESVFVARPRLKEFLLGHPAMLSGLFLYGRTKISREKAAAIILISLGMLGQTSIINTFCHPHADFILSALRTAYGLLLGCAIGGVVILCLKLVKKY